MLEWRGLGHRSGAHAESGRSALHIDDGMMTVFSGWRRRQPYNVLGLHLPHNLLECERRDVVALINNYLAVLDDKILHLFFAAQALDDRNVHASSPVQLPTANLPDCRRGQVQEHCQPLVPLIEQLLPMNHN